MLRAGNWEWYYPDNSDDGESIASIAGYSAPSVSSMKRHANVMKQEAAAILAMTEHREGEERAVIGVLHMGEGDLGHKAKLDSVVYLVAPDESGKGKSKGNRWRAVQSIEFGHMTRGDNPTRVAAVSPLRKAAKKMVAKRRLSIK